MSCPQCYGAVVFPKGLSGEIICKRCGLVLSLARSKQGFTRWSPNWFSNWSADDSDTLREWLTTLRTVSCQLNLPNFPYREEAARIIRSKNDMFFRSQRLGRNKRESVAALVYLVLRKYNKIRPLKEICRMLSLDHRLVMKYVWIMHKMNKFSRTFSAKDYLWKYGLKLTADVGLIKTAEHFLTKIRKEISGNPISLAAGTLYFICKRRKKKISKNEIGEAFHISGRTVYSNERKIRQVISIEA